MQIALIGFSKSGKTSVFNALTGANEEVSAYAGKAKTNRAIINVPDKRLDQLCELFESKKLVYATIDYIDPAGIRRDMAGQGGAMGDEMLNTIDTADALLAVIRAFEDDSGVDCDPEGDFDAIWLELILGDLAKVDRRLEKVEAQAKRVAGPQRQALLEEGTVLSRLKEALEDSKPIRSLEFTIEDLRILSSFQFLTTKPLLVLINSGNQNAEETEALQKKLQAIAGVTGEEETPLTNFLSFSGQTEMEIAQLDADDREMFLEEYGIEEPGMDRMIRASYEALGLISFLTVGPTEAHAWNLRKGLPAVEAAGVIHSDLQRGFIRAQVVRWDDLLKCKTFAEAKKQALLRLEGKEYIIQDGDVIEVMFSV